MQILYDLQKHFETAAPGMFENNDIIEARDFPPTTAVLEAVEDVKTLLITKRDLRECGIYIHIYKIPGLIPGDRITVTGRIGEGEPLGSSWSVTLLSVIDGHLTQHTAPGAIFSLSHILEAKELRQSFTVHTIGWGLKQPLMDFYIDNIIISRDAYMLAAKKDTRTVIYSLNDDPHLHLANVSEEDNITEPLVIVRSGFPKISVFQHEGKTALSIKNRVNDWDGMDINISYLNLQPGNKYSIIASGHISGNTPEGTRIMFQGVPTFDWRGRVVVNDSMDFTLEHTMTSSELEKWTSVRVTTNSIGASAIIDIYSLKIIRV